MLSNKRKQIRLYAIYLACDYIENNQFSRKEKKNFSKLLEKIVTIILNKNEKNNIKQVNI